MSVVSCVSAEHRPALEAALRTEGYALLSLDGTEVRDKLSLFRQAARDVLSGQASPPSSWDGLLDSLWQALAARDETAVAILWNDAQQMLEGGLEDLLVASRGLADVARQVATTEHGFPREVTLRVFLLGAGPNFPPFPREPARFR